MAHYVLTDAKVWVDAYDFSGDHNALALNYEADEVEDSNFGDDTHLFLGGLKHFDAQLEGAVNLDALSVEQINFNNVGVADTPVSLAPDTGADGETAYTMKALTSGFNPIAAQVGELARFSTTIAASNERLVRGTIMHNATRTSTATGVARQLGAVGATQKLYATLHVITVSGTNPTLDVILESDDEEAFGGSKETQITFTQKTAIGSQFATPVAGAIADDWWRVGWTIGGTDTPTFEFIVIVGIL